MSISAEKNARGITNGSVSCIHDLRNLTLKIPIYIHNTGVFCKLRL